MGAGQFQAVFNAGKDRVKAMATTATTTRLMTADELLAMPKDDCRYELVKGELITMAPVGGVHGTAGSRFDRRLGAFVEERGLGEVFIETGFVLSTDPDTVRAPDVSFVREDRLSDVPTSGFFPFAPDLAIEVVSPNDRYTEVAEKVAEYLAAGTRLVVVVNPRERTITKHPAQGEVTQLGEGDTLTLDDVVPGFECAAAYLFGRWRV